MDHAPRILCALHPQLGHTLPMLPVIAELVRRGCRVTATISPELADRVRATGAETITYTTPIMTKMPGYAAHDRLTYDKLVKGFSQALHDILANSPVIEKACQEPPDIIVHDAVLSLPGRVLAARWSRPNIRTLPTLASNEHYSLNQKFTELAPPAAPDAPPHPEVVRVVGGMLDYARAHGLSGERVDEALGGGPDELSLVFVPKEFQAAGDTFGDDHIFVGPCLDHTTQDPWQPPEGNPPVVLVSLGTAVNEQPELFRQCVQAFTGTQWHVVMALGNGVDPDDLGPLPSNVEPHRWIPLGSVLRHASVFVCHGGIGSVQESLHHGIPMVVIPDFPEHHVNPEQHANAERVGELGLGRVLHRETISPGLIRDTAISVATDDHIRTHVQRMREHIRTSGGATRAAHEIHARAMTSTS